MNNEIENIFNEKFDNFEATPREGLFEAILAKRKKKRRAIWMWSAAALLLIGTSYGLYSNSPSDNPTTDPIVDKTNTSNKVIEGNLQKEELEYRDVDTYIGDKSEAVNQGEIALENKQQKTIPATNVPKIVDSRPAPKDITPVTPSYTLPKPIKEESPELRNPKTSTPPDSPISNQELADLYKQIAANDKNADITKTKVFTKTESFEIDAKDERNFTPKVNSTPKVKDKKPNPTIDKPEDDIDSKDKDGEEKDKVTPPPFHKIVELSRWSIEASAAAGIGGRNLSGDQYYVSQRNSTESAKISNALSIAGIYQFDPKWNVQVGFSMIDRRENFSHTSDEITTYSERSETKTETVIHPVLGEIEREYTVVVKDTNTVDGATTQNTNSYKTINIPVVLERELFNKNKWSLIAKGGAMVSIYGNTSGNIINESNQITELNSAESRQSGMVSGILGLGAIYAPTDRISIVLYPQANVGFNSRFNNVAFTQREMGLYTHFGLRIRL